MNNKLIKSLNFLNTLSKEDIKTQFEKSFKKFEDVKYDVSFSVNVSYYDEFLIDLKANYLYNDENSILSNLDEYSIAA